MGNFIHLSDSSKIALHAMLHLAAVGSRALTQQEIAVAFDFSKAHLAKVMQQLRRAGLVDSIRGPSGGFVLARSAANITMLEIHSAVQRVDTPVACVLSHPRCAKRCCQFGTIVERMEREIIDYMGRTALAELAKNLPEYNSNSDR